MITLFKQTHTKNKRTAASGAKKSAPVEAVVAASEAPTAEKTPEQSSAVPEWHVPAADRGENLSGELETTPLPFVLPVTDKRLLLHVGCGKVGNKNPLHRSFQDGNWHEVKLDSNPEFQPDIVAEVFDLVMIPSESFDAVWAPHHLQRLYAHQVLKALEELYRVTKPGGLLMATLPDLQKIAEPIAQGKLEAVAYQSKAGTITPLDMLYGFRPFMANGALHLQHKTGFTARTIANRLQEAGFRMIQVERDGYNLSVVAHKVDAKQFPNPQVQIKEEDINAMMRKRDELDKEPEMWEGLK